MVIGERMRTEEEILERIEHFKLQIEVINNHAPNAEWWQIPVREDIISNFEWVLGDES